MNRKIFFTFLGSVLLSAPALAEQPGGPQPAMEPAPPAASAPIPKTLVIRVKRDAVGDQDGPAEAFTLDVAQKVTDAATAVAVNERAERKQPIAITRNSHQGQVPSAIQALFESQKPAAGASDYYYYWTYYYYYPTYNYGLYSYGYYPYYGYTYYERPTYYGYYWGGFRYQYAYYDYVYNYGPYSYYYYYYPW